MKHVQKESSLLAVIIILFIIMMGLFCNGWYNPQMQEDSVLYAIGAVEIAILGAIFLLWRLNRRENKRIDKL